MATLTVQPATFDADPPFLLRHPRARRSASFLGWLSGRAEKPRVVAPRLEPALPAESLPTELILVEPGPIQARRIESEQESVRIEPVQFEPVQIATIELPPADVAPAALVPVERMEIDLAASGITPLPAIEAVVSEPQPIPAVAATAPQRRGWARRIAGGLLSAAAYVTASIMLLAAGPVYLVMAADREDLVRWSNDLLDMLLRW